MHCIESISFISPFVWTFLSLVNSLHFPFWFQSLKTSCHQIKSDFHVPSSLFRIGYLYMNGFAVSIGTLISRWISLHVQVFQHERLDRNYLAWTFDGTWNVFFSLRIDNIIQRANLVIEITKRGKRIIKQTRKGWISYFCWRKTE